MFEIRQFDNTSQTFRIMLWMLVLQAQGHSHFEPRSVHVGFVVNKVALRQVFSEYFGFPCQFSFHQLLHIHHHLSSGFGTIGQLVADVPSGLSLTPPYETKKRGHASVAQPGASLRGALICTGVSRRVPSPVTINDPKPYDCLHSCFYFLTI
jgi:hypothetical protein